MKSESRIAKELGISRVILKQWRMSGLIGGWEKNGNKIFYHEEGEADIREKVRLEVEAKDLGEAPPPPDAPTEMVITQIPRNTRLVVCGEAKVRVKNNIKFRKGMKIRARRSIDGPNWVQVGRCPRRNGVY